MMYAFLCFKVNVIVTAVFALCISSLSQKDIFTKEEMIIVDK